MNVGATLPGPVTSGAQPARTTGDDKGDADFGSHLRNAEQTAQPPRAQDQAKSAAFLQPHWPDLVTKFTDSDDKAMATADDATDPSPEGSDEATTSATAEPKDKDRKAKHAEDHQPHAEIPLLIALSEPRTAPASGEADAKAKAGITADMPQAPTGETSAPAPGRLETMVASVAANDPAAIPRDKARTSATEVRNGKPDVPQTPSLAGPANSANPASSANPANPAKPAGPVGPANPTDPADLAGPDRDEKTSQEPVSALDRKADKESPKSTLRNSRVDGQAASPAHVVVTGEHNFPAPAQHPASQTVTSLASAIAMDGSARAAFSPSNGLPQWASTVAQSSHILKIELHPAELGMITASLRLSGGQLSIELTPENHEAHRRLSSDADSLVKSLHAMGFDVDKVTVLQPSIAAPATARTDNAAMNGGAGGRDSSSFQSGNSGGDGNMSGGQQSGRNRNNDGHNHEQNAPAPRLRPGGDRFI
ncbi:flagellar hook-length control protein FliK [Mesorhizobium sp. A623]